MKHNPVVMFDKMLVGMFSFFGALSLYGVLAKGAWWHITSVVICAVIVKTAYSEIKKQKSHEAAEN